MATELQNFNSAVKLVQQFVPNYTVSLKKNSTIHKIIGWILSKIGNTQYMSDYITTLGQNTALPSSCESEDTTNLWQVIAHEGRHALDAQKMSNIVFGFLYLFPQALGILGVIYGLALIPILICGGSLSLLWGLLSIVLLAPIPAIGRTILELRGYTMSLTTSVWSGAVDSSTQTDYVAWITSQFISGNYYYMFPFKGFITSYFNKKMTQLQTNTLICDAYLSAFKTFSVNARQ